MWHQEARGMFSFSVSVDLLIINCFTRMNKNKAQNATSKSPYQAYFSTVIS